MVADINDDKESLLPSSDSQIPFKKDGLPDKEKIRYSSGRLDNLFGQQ